MEGIPENCRVLPNTSGLKIIHFLVHIRDYYPEYYVRLCECSRDVLTHIYGGQGQPESSLNEEQKASAFRKLTMYIRNITEDLNSRSGEYYLMFINDRQKALNLYHGGQEPGETQPQTRTTPAGEAGDGTSNRDSLFCGESKPGVEGIFNDPLHTKFQQPNSVLSDFIRRLFTELLHSESKKVLTKKEGVMSRIREFYEDHRGSIFSTLGQHDGDKNTKEEARKLLQALAPERSPHVGDVSPFVISQFDIAKSTMKKTQDQKGRTVRTVEYFPCMALVNEMNQNKDYAPLFSVYEDPAIVDKEAPLTQEAFAYVGLTPIRVSTNGKIDWSPEVKELGFRLAKPLESGLWVDGKTRVYGHRQNVSVEGRFESRFFPVYVKDKIGWSRADYFAQRSSDAQKIYGRLHWVTTAQKDGNMKLSMHPCAKMDLNWVKTGRKWNTRIVKEYNDIWTNYHSAEEQWLRMETENEKQPIIRIMQDILLLDMSRFGWAPCWSTPEDTTISEEVGKEDTFRNDLAEFLSEEEKKRNAPMHFEQTRPQWKVTEYMHGKEFLKVRRATFARHMLKISSAEKISAYLSAVPSNGVDRVAQFSNWLKGEHNPGTMNEMHASFVSTINEYSCDEHNDVSALCVCFTATYMLVRKAMCESFTASPTSPFYENILNVTMNNEFLWTGPYYQFSVLFRRFKWLTLKTMSVPAHVTLKHHPGEWAHDTAALASFSQVRAENLAFVMGDVSSQRSKLESDFIAHATATRHRTGEENVLHDNIINTGLTCGMALRSVDYTVLCSRARLVFPTRAERDSAYDVLTRTLTDMTTEQATALLSRWKTSKMTPDGEKEFFERANMKNVTTFVRTYFQGLLPTHTKHIQQVFKKMANEHSAGILPLDPRKQESFVCDLPVNKILAAALSRSNLEALLSRRMNASRRIRYSLPGQSNHPTCFKDPVDDKELFLVCMIRVDTLVTEFDYTADSSLSFSSDLEIDRIVKALETDCPRHNRPLQFVQDEFKAIMGSKNKNVDVWRMDWWVGSDTGTDINSYEAAKAVTPLLPYRFSEKQMSYRNQEFPELSNELVPERNPFHAAGAVQRSTTDLASAMAAIGQMANTSEFVANKEEYTRLTRLFEPMAIKLYEIEPFTSIAHVCRIAFGLLTHGPLIVANGVCRLTDYKDIVTGDVARLDVNDIICWRLDTIAEFSRQRAFLDEHGWNGASVLPPFQHPEILPANEPRNLFAGPVSRHMLAYPGEVTGVFRWLQTRISMSSRMIEHLRRLSMKNDDLYEEIEQFELQSQVAWKYKNSHFNAFANQDVVINANTQGARTLARFMFSHEFVPGRIKRDISNEMQALNTVNNKIPYFDTSELYMASSVSNFKYMISKVKPLTRQIDEDEQFRRFQRAARHMAQIADGIRTAKPLITYMNHASTILKRKKATVYRFAPAAIEIVMSRLGGVINDFENEHSRLEDAARSYADMASFGARNIDEFKDRFFGAYRKVQLFRKKYNVGITGFLVHIAAMFKGASTSGDTKGMIDSLYNSIDLMLTSDAFFPALSTMSNMFANDTAFAQWMGGINVYTSFAARTHTNALLGCATAAVPYRNVPSQIEMYEWAANIRTAILFDTVGGFIGPGGEIAKFFCFLPTAADLFDDGVEERCHRVGLKSLSGGKFKFVKKRGDDDEDGMDDYPDAKKKLKPSEMLGNDARKKAREARKLQMQDKYEKRDKRAVEAGIYDEDAELEELLQAGVGGGVGDYEPGDQQQF